MASNRDDFGIAIRYALLQKGAKQKFSLFFLICLSIFIFFLDSFSNKFMSGTRAIINDGIYRVSVISTSPFKFFKNMSVGTKDMFLIYKENKILKDELSKLRSQNFETEFLTIENKRLQEILDSKISDDVLYVTSKVLLDKKSPFLKSIIINKGSRSGIIKGMPVLSEIYLIGRVVEVNFLSSRVLLLNDLNSRIPVTFGDKAVQSILAGKGDKEPNLEYLPELFLKKEGQTVFTSGKDGIFKAGIPIGKTKILEDQVKVKLFTDPNQLSFVRVLLETENLESNF